MKEDLISNNFITDDNFFGDTPFGETNEKEILRAGSALDESVYKESDASKITIDEEKDDAIERASVTKSTLGIYIHHIYLCFINLNLKKQQFNTNTVTFVVRKDTRSPGPHCKCH